MSEVIQPTRHPAADHS